ncbi:uncharacterized protein LOC131038524 isoform X2 [Cryptomeria japonica]|uniref:uncharacterized protein LOC131038524 isoform X2 n=1 Tax=Cryptomeria japonica TaxID=3369 RepID=UPI0027DA9781|nr:uncharacterized protein LOC131038524 isoform X2 [Cryptomeria japonica]
MAKMKINKGRSQFLDVDWSVISVSSIRSVFEELICQLMGVDRPLERWRGADVNDVYQRYSTAALGNGSTRFPIKGVIYDMLCFIQRAPSNAISPIASTSVSDGRRDWSNLIPAFTSSSTSTSTGTSCSSAVTASEVAQRLGVHNLPGLQDKILTESKGRLAKKQMLEEVMGRGDSARDKYMEKIRAKKMMAQARRERERFSINTSTNAYTAQSTPSQKAWSITPSSPALVRYLEERGIRQALIARGDQSQLNELLEELRNYKFQYLRNLEMDETGKSTSEVINSTNHYNEILKSFCAIWGLPPWQVLLVIADDAQDESLRKAIADSQFFVCKVRNLSCPEDVNSTGKELSHVGYSKKSNHNLGLFKWFKRLSEGTLHEDDVRESDGHNSKYVHFKVTDMTELKWIIEDMNGVTYRTSTFVQGFQ